MTRRKVYRLDLSQYAEQAGEEVAPRVQLRTLKPGDADDLAELMIDAYRGTIDYDGETVEEAKGEVAAYLAGERGGRPLLDQSRLAFADTLMVGACLVATWQTRQAPLIGYVMTRAAWKGQGVGRRTLEATLSALRQQGAQEAWAVITEGNTPSERLFRRLGFEEIAEA